MSAERLRKWVPGAAAVVLVLSLFFVSQGSVAAHGSTKVAAGFRFHELPIAMPPGYDTVPKRTVRRVNPAYQHIRSWISSVGASIAINDLTGHGRSDGMCIVDTRTDDVIVTYTPTARQSDRFTPFVLDPAPLPMKSTMAPMGCTPGDFNRDGRMDLLVAYWGRTPILFLSKSRATRPSPDAYVPRELVSGVSTGGQYHGPKWNTNAVAVADLEGNGHPDIVIGNYFPPSDVLDPHGRNNVVMNDSLSNARNGGGDHVFRWSGGTAGDNPTARYAAVPDAIPFDAATGWTLAIAAADLTGDARAELYVANDFGHDHLLYNRSTPGHIRFTEAYGARTPQTPKSFVMGNDSFKGMGVDFADIDHNGSFDMMVSNITTPWGLQESNYVWINQARNERQMRADLAKGLAPFDQRAEELGMAWTGWCWDVKLADFDDDGSLEAAQTDGFVKGTTDRWNWLQELAMTNDDLLADPAMWPNVEPGDDIAGHQKLAFYARNTDGRYVDVSEQLGLAVPTPTRGIAVGDTTGDGALDLAVARQWGAPAFYANESPERGHYLDLLLYRPVAADLATGLHAPGTPAYGATATVTTADGRSQVSHLDGGSGHGGKRSFEVHFGLGSNAGPVTVALRWRDGGGALHDQRLRLRPGRHTLLLGKTASEVNGR